MPVGGLPSWWLVRRDFAVADCNVGLDSAASCPFAVRKLLEVGTAEEHLGDLDCTCCCTCWVSGHVESVHIDSFACLHMQRFGPVPALALPVLLVVPSACLGLQRVAVLEHQAPATCSSLIGESWAAQTDQ